MGSSSLQNKPASVLVALAFLCLYLCWGATYAANSVGVSLLPATVLAGTRLTISGSILLAFCFFTNKKILLPRQILQRLWMLGVIMLFGGHIGLVWSEKYIASGLAALLVAVTPLYAAVIESLLPGGERLRRRGVIGLLLGFLGLIALLWRSVISNLQGTSHGSSMQIIASIVLLLGALSFASGSVLSRRMNLPVHPLVAAGWEMLAAGVAELTYATLSWQWPHAVWNERSIAAITYLIFFGSLLGFSCYIWLIHHVPVAKVATYAYVNPAVAVILGVVLLGEHPHPSEYVGMAAVVGAVALVTSSQMKSGKTVAELEVTPIEDKA